jgi:hypothetical protein
MALLIPNAPAVGPSNSTVTISATDAAAGENPLNGGVFTVTRTGATTAALLIRLAITGTATPSEDYFAIPSTVTIPIGSSTADINVTIINDALVENDETIIATITPDPSYNIGGNSSATITVTSDDISAPSFSTVTIAATDAEAGEPSNPGEFTFTRTAPLTDALTVSYGVTGSATNGVDFINLPGTITIAANSATAVLPVTVINDDLFETTETIICTIQTNANYIVSTTNSATVNISSEDVEPPATGEIYQDFTTLSAVPSGWTHFGINAPTFSEGMVIQKDGATGASFGVSQLRSPVFIPKDDQVVEIEYEATYEFSGIGFGQPSTWGQFQLADAVFALNNDLHNGNSAFNTGIGYAGGRLMKLKLTFHSGATAMLVQVYAQLTPGIYTLQKEQNLGLPESWYSGLRIFTDMFSGGMKLLRVTGVAGNENYKVAASIPQNFIGYNFELVALSGIGDNADSVTMAQTIRKIGGKRLRFPGGDGANYWNWDEGGIIGDAMADPSGDGRRYPPGFDRTAEPLPVHLRYEVSKQSFTLPNLSRVITNSGAVITWVVNMNTSGGGGQTGVQKELRHLQEAAALGYPITNIELANELYFGIPNYMWSVSDGEPSNSTNAVYASKAKNYAQIFKAAFPAAKIYAIGTADARFLGSRERDWNAALNTENLWGSVDGITIHPYYGINEIGAQMADVGNAARAETLAKLALQKLRVSLRAPSLGVIPAGKHIMMTEHNFIEDANNPETGFVILGNSWLGALLVDAHNHEFLKYPRIKGSDLHTLTGNVQWDGMVNEVGAHVDPTKRGVQTNPGTNGLAPRLGPTVTGLVCGLSAKVFDGGVGKLVQDGVTNEGVFAWAVTRGGVSGLSAINLTNSSFTLTMPAEITSGLPVKVYTAAPWSTPIGEAGFPTPALSTVSGATLNLPAFSKVIIGQLGETPPTATVTDVQPTPVLQSTTTDFRTLSSLPSGWVASNPGSLTYSDTRGVAVPSLTSGWALDTLYSPTFQFTQLTKLEIEVAGVYGASTIGLSRPGGWGDFNGVDCLMIANGGNLHTGEFGVHEFGSQNGEPNNFYKYVLTPSGSTVTIEVFRKLSGQPSFVSYGTHTLNIPSAIINSPTSVLVDAGYSTAELISVTQFFLA